MDSMRSLNTSLPRSPRKQRSTQPPEELIQAFKAAALSVTNLYKTAVTDESQARQAGYQDALDDLLSFLDKKNLGLDDGEGWRVRQWATERLDGSPPAPNGSDSDEERETSKAESRTIPARPQNADQETEHHRQPSRSRSPTRAAPVPPPLQPPSSNENVPISEPLNTFTFRSTHPYPQDVDMQPPDIASIDLASSEPVIEAETPPNGPALRVEIVPRAPRTPHRGSNHTNRHATRSATSTRIAGSGAGTKRKIPFGDYFDLGSLGDPKDGGGGGGGGKRSRFI